MVEGKDVRWSMVVNRLIADWMTFVNAYNRQESRLRTIQVIISPFGRTEKVFYSEEPMCYMMLTIRGIKVILEKCKK